MTAKWHAVATAEELKISFFLSGEEFGYQYELSMLHNRALMQEPLIRTQGIPEKGLPMRKKYVDVEGLREQFFALYQAIHQQNTQSFRSGSLSGSYIFQEFKDQAFFLHEMLHVEDKMMLQTVELSIESVESLSYYFDQVS